jgi:CxxC-x17-CxxC domain-containing protein
MAFEDRSLQCFDCGATFVFSASEQEFYAAKGFSNDPKRCPACRQARKAQRYGDGGYGGYGRRREMFPAVCAECGKECQVPFEPREGRPVYCSDCYSRVRLSNI